VLKISSWRCRDQAVLLWREAQALLEGVGGKITKFLVTCYSCKIFIELTPGQLTLTKHAAKMP